MSSSIEKRKKFGVEIKVLLAKYGIRQNELAVRMGITRQYVCQICSGKSSLTADFFEKLYEILVASHAQEEELLLLFEFYLDSKFEIPYKKSIGSLKDMEITLVRKFRSLSPEAKDQVIIYIEKLLEKKESQD